MAKHCEVCHQEYPDAHATCPHCAAKAAAKPAEQPAAGPADDDLAVAYDTETVDMSAILQEVPTSLTQDVPAYPTLDMPSAAPTATPRELEEPVQYATTRDISELFRAGRETGPARTAADSGPTTGAAATQKPTPEEMQAAINETPAAAVKHETPAAEDEHETLAAAVKHETPAAPVEHATPAAEDEHETLAENPEVDELAAQLAEKAPRPAADHIFDSSKNLATEEAVDFTQEPAEYDIGASQVNLGSSAPAIHGLTESRLSFSQEALERQAAPANEFVPPAVAEEPDVAEAAEEIPEEPAEVAAPARKEKPALRPYLIGGVAGAVVGTAAVFGLTVLGVLPTPKETTVATGPQPALQSAPPAGTASEPAAPTSTAPAAPAFSGEQYLAVGDFGKAVEAFGAAPTPDALTKRGLARWLQYLQQQKQANAALNAQEQAVVDAKKDLADAKTAEATYWLGHIEEMLAGPAAARKIYEEGAKQFKDQAGLFQAALDRLDALAEEKAAGPVSQGHSGLAPDGRTALVLLVAAALQAEAPAAKEAAEAGFDFWRAVKLAKENKYDEAIAALQAARTSHDHQRFRRLRQSQNPTSDPTEQIFLRCCDELAAAWKVRQVLARDGYLAAGKSADPVKALEGALAAAKTSKPVGRDPALTAVIDSLKKDKDVTAADPEVKDAAKAVDGLIRAKKQSAAQIAEARAASGEAAKEMEKALKDKKATEDRLVKLTKKLEAADETHQTLQEVQKRLIDAKYLDPAADAAATVHGVEKVIAEKASPTAVRVPVAFRTPDPQASERHYSAGVRLYWTGRYPQAEKELAQAIRYNDRDARYVYYLGLSQLAQGSDDAAQEAFRRAGQLEQQQLPPRELVNDSLERVQGADRKLLNRYRP